MKDIIFEISLFIMVLIIIWISLPTINNPIDELIKVLENEKNR